MNKLRLPAFLLLAFALCLAASAEGSFITIVTNLDGNYCSNLMEPLVIEGQCSADIVEIKVQYRLRRGVYEKLPSGMEQIIETYTLRKYVPGSGIFLYRIFQGLGNLDFGSNIYEIIGTTASGASVSTTLQIFYNEYFGEKAKPVIYLYPESRQRVFVDVQPKDGLSVTIPEKGGGWSVTVSPNGDIVNEGDGRSYPYLFWEGPDRGGRFDPEAGFVVARAELPGFFREKLAILGLNARETGDFLDFWIPLLSSEDWYLIAFSPQALLDAEAPLTISPAPDSLIRVFFDHRGLEAPLSIPEQRLEKVERKGFAVIEWGGRRYGGR